MCLVEVRPWKCDRNNTGRAKQVAARATDRIGVRIIFSGESSVFDKKKMDVEEGTWVLRTNTILTMMLWRRPAMPRQDEEAGHAGRAPPPKNVAHGIYEYVDLLQLIITILSILAAM